MICIKVAAVMIICMISNFSYGYGIRYEYGIFTQKIKGTEQVGFFYVFCHFSNFLQEALCQLAQILFIHRLKSPTTGCALEIHGRRFSLIANLGLIWNCYMKGSPGVHCAGELLRQCGVHC